MKHILLIDPEKTTLELSKKFLENHGFKVTTCESAGDAINYLMNPEIDLIISEIDIVGLDGFDLRLILRRYHRNVPLVFLTSRDDQTTRKEAKAIGVDALISKQTEYTTLPKVVGGILHNFVPLAS